MLEWVAAVPLVVGVLSVLYFLLQLSRRKVRFSAAKSTHKSLQCK